MGRIHKAPCITPAAFGFTLENKNDFKAPGILQSFFPVGQEMKIFTVKPLTIGLSFFLCSILSIGCSGKMSTSEINIRLNRIAESYVRLVLAVGQHDSIYVDAYYGPKEWLAEAQSERKSLEDIRNNARVSTAGLDSITIGNEEEILQLRYQYLKKQLSALVARVEVLSGKKLTFDEEAKAYYDVTPVTYPEEHFQKIIMELDSLLPGKGPLSERLTEFRKQFIVSSDKLDTIFQTAIRECRKRTKKHITLASNENFKLEFVRNKPWGGYNWYMGGNQSLIQINLDQPIYIERAINLAAHEGYPGHHVYNCLLETAFSQKFGWVEFTVYPLFSPQSLIAEGTANFGIEVAFPGKEQMEFERDVLFPLAGMDKSQAEVYSKVRILAGKLGSASNEAARLYLDGKISRSESVEWLIRNGAMSHQRAQGLLNFIDQYRSYVINYNVGLDLVRQYIEHHGGTEDRPEKRWEEFTKLISSPRLPSGLL
jgi:hypothetical protein